MKLINSVKSLKNKEAGRRAFILANGPSIAKEDLSILKNELTIGMNASTLLESAHGFHSDYYVLSDTRFITHPEKRQLATTALHPETIRILRSELKAVDHNALANPTYYIPALQRDGFSRNLHAGYFFGCTTTMLAIQLAYYLGVSEIYLLGCDLRYQEESPRFYRETNPQLEDSFTSVQIWNIVNAGEQLEIEGKKLVNCSEISFLRPYIEYVPFEQAVKRSADIV
ncbi:6-hydroxymethylpterin diphosphokinase MptE-like protein [Pseudomonas sp. NPDC089569]|uniref:6-hydroxymethylpterin diphosphokinase MptE-like protein n=1 Tax=Pseudomonas sp. NPDC089569 TaxID=3390722 RepID=UPI003D0259FF